MELRPLHCPTCGSVIPGDEVILELSLARCTACRSVFDLAGRKGAELQADQPKRPPRAQVPLPQKFVVDDRRHGGLTVRWRWFQPAAYFLVFWCLIWDAALVSFLAGAGGFAPFLIFHLAAGVGMTYWTLSLFLNSTVVEATRDRLSIRHGPLPWPGNLELTGREVAQLYGTEEIHRGKNGTSITYSLNAIDRQQHKKRLLKGLKEVEQVLWLEQALERHLGIEDAPVDGEVARRAG